MPGFSIGPAAGSSQIVGSSSLPASPTFRSIYVTPTGLYICLSDGSWTLLDVNEGDGTVTSVSVVTANGFSGSVANASTTPAITLNNPTALVATTSVQAPFFVSAAADPADSGAVRLGNTELIAWEKATPGTDWTLGVNSSDVLQTNAPLRALTITDDGLTAGRVTYAGTSGLLSDDSGFTYNSATHALTTTTFVGALSGNATTASAVAVGGITGLGTGVATALAINIGTAGSPVLNGGALGSPSTAGTLPAFTLGGTVSADGNQINNVIIGTTTPLAGFFTTVNKITITQPANNAVLTIADGLTLSVATENVSLNQSLLKASTPTFSLLTLNANASARALHLVGRASDNANTITMFGSNAVTIQGQIEGGVGFIALNDLNGTNIVKITNAALNLPQAGFANCTALTTVSNVVGCTASDEKLKKGFKAFSRGLEFVRNVIPQTYSFRAKTRWYDGRVRLGLVAQDVQKVLPEAVWPIGPDQPLQVDYQAVSAAHHAALQALDAQMQALNARFNTLWQLAQS